MAEQLTLNQRVQGSSPWRLTPTFSVKTLERHRLRRLSATAAFLCLPKQGSAIRRGLHGFRVQASSPTRAPTALTGQRSWCRSQLTPLARRGVWTIARASDTPDGTTRALAGTPGYS